MLKKLFMKKPAPDTAPSTCKKKIIFIGGAKGIGKHAMAKRIQSSIENTIIINKEETSVVLRETLMDMYGRRSDNTVSPEYLHKVEPLEYKQLIKTMEHITDYNECNIIVVAQFFNQFGENNWLKTMRNFCKYRGYDFEFIFLYRDREKISANKYRHFRTNTKLREKINFRINNIKKSAFIKKYSTDEVFAIN